MLGQAGSRPGGGPGDGDAGAPGDGDARAPGGGLIDRARLASWLDGKLPVDAGDTSGELRLARIGEGIGIGNALYELRLGRSRFVLRRPPKVRNAPSANNMVREFRVLSALRGSSVPHPDVLLLCEDLEVIGAPFLVMEHIDGFAPVNELPAPYDTDPEARHGLGTELVDAIAELALFDWRSAGLDGFGKPDGFLERQVSRWLGQLAGYRTRDIDELDFVARWLEANLPQASPPAVIHGDYSPFNVMFRHGAPARMAAIVDWDTSTVGDPLLDLGHLLSRWDEAGEESIIGHTSIPIIEGLPTRAELSERYAARTGLPLDHLDYYQVLALFKLACILEGHYFQALQGIRDAETKEKMGEAVPRLMKGAARIARGERR